MPVREATFFWMPHYQWLLLIGSTYVPAQMNQVCTPLWGIWREQELRQARSKSGNSSLCSHSGPNNHTLQASLWHISGFCLYHILNKNAPIKELEVPRLRLGHNVTAKASGPSRQWCVNRIRLKVTFKGRLTITEAAECIQLLGKYQYFIINMNLLTVHYLHNNHSYSSNHS